MNGETQLTDPAPATTLGESRARVLALLRAATDPLGVAEVARGCGLHSNTARFHLDGLVDSDLAERTTGEHRQPGRPRALYRATAGTEAAGQRSYRLLAEILSTLVAEHMPQPQRVAVEAGRAWGGYLPERPAPYERIGREEALDRLMQVLAEIGFDPEVDDGQQQDTDAAGTRVCLHHCPFREVAEHHRDVVCSLHLGLMQGALTALRAPMTTDRLEPFVTPNLCIAQLTEHEAAAAGSESGASTT